jgi:hypothetical protein
VAVKQSWYSTAVVVVLFLDYTSSKHCDNQLGQLVLQYKQRPPWKTKRGLGIPSQGPPEQTLG